MNVCIFLHSEMVRCARVKWILKHNKRCLKTVLTLIYKNNRSQRLALEASLSKKPILWCILTSLELLDQKSQTSCKNITFGSDKHVKIRKDLLTGKCSYNNLPTWQRAGKNARKKILESISVKCESILIFILDIYNGFARVKQSPSCGIGNQFFICFL